MPRPEFVEPLRSRVATITVPTTRWGGRFRVAGHRHLLIVVDL